MKLRFCCAAAIGVCGLGLNAASAAEYTIDLFTSRISGSLLQIETSNSAKIHDAELQSLGLTGKVVSDGNLSAQFVIRRQRLDFDFTGLRCRAFSLANTFYPLSAIGCVDDFPFVPAHNQAFSWAGELEVGYFVPLGERWKLQGNLGWAAEWVNADNDLGLPELTRCERLPGNPALSLGCVPISARQRHSGPLGRLGLGWQVHPRIELGARFNYRGFRTESSRVTIVRESLSRGCSNGPLAAVGEQLERDLMLAHRSICNTLYSALPFSDPGWSWLDLSLDAKLGAHWSLRGAYEFGGSRDWHGAELTFGYRF